MALNYPDNSSLYPYLHKNGYRIKAIGKKIAVNSNNKTNVEKFTSKKINNEVQPEIIFQHEKNKELLLLECKVSGFEVDFEHRNTKQALGYLCCGDDHIQSYLGLKDKRENNVENQILYAVAGSDIKLQMDTLEKLSKITSDAGVSSLPFIVSGVEIDDEDIYLKIVKSSSIDRVKIVEKGVPHVLYLIPLDPGVNKKDPESLKLLEQKVSLTLRSIIGRNIGLKGFEIQIKSFFEKVIPVWNLWDTDSQKHVKGLIKKYIREALRRLEKKGLKFEFNVENQEYRIEKVSSQQATKIRSYLVSSDFTNLIGDIFQDNQLSFEDIDKMNNSNAG